jgi:hypothetical protein
MGVAAAFDTVAAKPAAVVRMKLRRSMKHP